MFVCRIILLKVELRSYNLFSLYRKCSCLSFGHIYIERNSGFLFFIFICYLLFFFASKRILTVFAFFYKEYICCSCMNEYIIRQSAISFLLSPYIIPFRYFPNSRWKSLCFHSTEYIFVTLELTHTFYFTYIFFCHSRLRWTARCFNFLYVAYIRYGYTNGCSFILSCFFIYFFFPFKIWFDYSLWRFKR